MPAQAQRVYAALDAELDKGTGVCEPSIPRMAAQLGISPRHVIRMLNWLEAHDWIVAERVSGKKNRYVSEVVTFSRGKPVYGLAKHVTGDTHVTGQGDVTGDTRVTGTRDTHVTGQQIPPIEGFKEQEKEGRSHAEQGSEIPEGPPDLFGGAHSKWIVEAVSYFIGGHPDDPQVASMGPWLPTALAKFFLFRSWKEPNDAHNAQIWAEHLAELAVTETEFRAAVKYTVSTPPEYAGRRLYARPDYFNHLVGHIRSQRRAAAAKASSTPAAARVAESGGGISPDIDAAWRDATDAEREQARAEVLAGRPELARFPGMVLTAAKDAVARRTAEARP
jgi:hypothetical protein